MGIGWGFSRPWGEADGFTDPISKSLGYAIPENLAFDTITAVINMFRVKTSISRAEPESRRELHKDSTAMEEGETSMPSLVRAERSSIFYRFFFASPRLCATIVF
jgi:hypothetical protein